MDFSRFKALTFDCYGTLIDWEDGIGSRLASWAQGQGLNPDREELLAAFGRIEPRAQEEHPSEPYRQILHRVFAALADELQRPVSEAELDAFGGSVGDWPAFPDSAAALARLKKRFHLVVVSNVDRASFAESNEKLGAPFSAVVTAEEVGAYKPDHRMFHRAFAVLLSLGVEREEILHVAQSLYHDHVPAKALGLSTVWVDRRAGREVGATLPPESDVKPDLTVGSLAELANLAVPAAS
jgi:putative hydrolase of the HAD superfamily